MLMHEMIWKKRNGQALSAEEINQMIVAYTKGDIPDYQMSAMLMAIYFQGMNHMETSELTRAMTESGDVIDLSGIQGFKVDKHSTGGVGDTTTLILGPMVAACDVPFAKMSGRGLGHTGGTLDKLESIPGFNITMSKRRFIETVNTVGIAIIGQSADLAPADKSLYALRDVTATVDSIPLIAASIMSKKLAAGSDGIVLDVKRGNGAFMKSTDDAEKLASTMVETGIRSGKAMTALVTNMDQPLGYAVGNSLEIIEAVNILKGSGPDDLLKLCLELGSHMLMQAHKANSPEEGRELLRKSVDSGKAFQTFCNMVKNQGGDIRCLENTSLLPSAEFQTPVIAASTGYIHAIDAMTVGKAAMQLGAGRTTAEDRIDPAVGVLLQKKIGEKVNRGEAIAILHHNNEGACEAAQKQLLTAFEIQDCQTGPEKLIWSIINEKETKRLY